MQTWKIVSCEYLCKCCENSMACFKFARHLQILQILNIDRHLLELFLICKDNSLTRPANVSKHVQKLGFTHICEQTKYTAKYVLQISSLHTQVKYVQTWKIVSYEHLSKCCENTVVCCKLARHLPILQILNIDRYLLELFLLCKDISLT